jgi:hypothetical protein
LLAFSTCGCRVQQANRHSASPAATFPDWQIAGEELDVTCRPLYYARWSDRSLVPVHEARVGEDFDAAGIVFEITDPEHLAGKVIAFHFDWPQKWDAWYKHDVHYLVTVREQYIGSLAFLCDPGFPVASGSPNQPTPANAAHSGGCP